jgi:predicted TIM-barrel fold metal-dependent hydrolase
MNTRVRSLASRREFALGALGLGAAALPGPGRAAAESLQVDSHTHTFIQGLPLAADARYAPDYDASYQRLLATANRNGLGRVVIAQPSFLGHDNSYLFRALAAEPRRLRGVPWIEPGTTTAQWDQMSKLGVVGLRFPIRGLPTPNWADYRETLAEASRRGWHLHLYVESERLPQILPVLLASGANVVIPHMGLFDPKLGPAKDPGFRVMVESAKTGRVYVMFTAPYRSSVEGARAAAPLLLDAFGPDRIVWGSDWPHTNTDLDRVTTYPQMLQSLSEWVPDPATRRRILVDTPARLFRFA